MSGRAAWNNEDLEAALAAADAGDAGWWSEVADVLAHEVRRLQRQLVEIRVAADTPEDQAHDWLLTKLRRLVLVADESVVLGVQHRVRGQIIEEVAFVIDGEWRQFPGADLAARARALKDRAEELELLLAGEG